MKALWIFRIRASPIKSKKIQVHNITGERIRKEISNFLPPSSSVTKLSDHLPQLPAYSLLRFSPQQSVIEFSASSRLLTLESTGEVSLSQTVSHAVRERPLSLHTNPISKKVKVTTSPSDPDVSGRFLIKLFLSLLYSSQSLLLSSLMI
ncbi:hypothetical protein VNO77_47068 [Canavalia gladiata]|uniref:Uncharacterized protein n=1 Tax=Canavalia gladiata TaxID=3824 RepID=A0AAN9JHF7_CANGL